MGDQLKTGGSLVVSISDANGLEAARMGGCMAITSMAPPPTGRSGPVQQQEYSPMITDVLAADSPRKLPQIALKSDEREHTKKVLVALFPHRQMNRLGATIHIKGTTKQ